MPPYSYSTHPTANPRRLAGLLVLLFALPAQLPAQPSAAPERLIAIGDIHGSYDGLTTILRRAGLVDERLRWSGGRTVVVQTGDFTDRGADVRKVMDLLMQLEREAKAAGGQFLVLAGNHEVMNMIGDLRDVTRQICSAFVSSQSDARRESAWDQYQRVSATRARVATPSSKVYGQTRAAWTTTHPLGCMEYRDAMSPTGLYGRWLREKDIAAVVGDTLFMHAGFNPSRPAPKSIAEVNKQVRAEVRRLDEFRKRLAERRFGLPFFDLQEVLDVAVVELERANTALTAAKADGAEPSLDIPLLREAQEIVNIPKWSLIDPEGPLWFRGYATWPEESTATQVTTFLDQMKVARIVVGHTPTNDRRIATRYGGRVVTIDTGMLAPYFMGNPSALEIVGGRMKAIYPDGEVELTLPKAALRLVPGGTPSNTRASIPEALATAKLRPLRLRSGGTPGIGRG